MALNIKSLEVEKLAREVAAIAKETKTEAIRRALQDRKERLMIRRNNLSKGDRLQMLLEQRIWPEIPRKLFGRSLSKKAREAILGYGPHGV